MDTLKTVPPEQIVEALWYAITALVLLYILSRAIQMAAFREITTYRKVTGVLNLIRAVAGEVSGRERNVHNVQEAFMAGFTQELWRLTAEAFDAKSAGGRDEFGNRWKPLALSTIRRKLGSVWSRTRRAAYDRLIQSGIPASVAREKAIAAAWAEVGGLRSSVAINVASGRLRASLEPGQISNERYIPPDEQITELLRDSVKMSSAVSYSKHVDKIRPIFPDPHTLRLSWLPRAIGRGSEILVDRLAEIV